MLFHRRPYIVIRSSSKYYCNSNENCKKATGLDWQNNNFARESRLFVYFFAVVARLQRETSYFHVSWRTWTQDNNFLFLFLNFDTLFFF